MPIIAGLQGAVKPPAPLLVFAALGEPLGNPSCLIVLIVAALAAYGVPSVSRDFNGFCSAPLALHCVSPFLSPTNWSMTIVHPHRTAVKC